MRIWIGWLVWLLTFPETHAQLTQASLTGTWIGVCTEREAGVFSPLATYLDLPPNGAGRLGLVDESAPARNMTWALTGDTLQLDGFRFAPGLVTLQDNILRIGKLAPLLFRRFKNVPIDSAQASQLLTGQVWQTDSLLVSLYRNGRVCLENRTTHARTLHYWRLARQQQSVFIVVQGSRQTRTGSYKPLWQLMILGSGLFGATGWNGHRLTTETFRRVRTLLPGDSCRATGFQPCDNGFISEYWQPPASFDGTLALYTLRQLARKAYRAVDLVGQSGLIQIRFAVNCADEWGLLAVTGLDEQYCPRLFDARIVGQLTRLCHDQVPKIWLDQLPTEHGDLSVVLQFQFKDGHLTDVFL